MDTWVSFRSDKNVLKSVMVLVIKPCKYMKTTEFYSMWIMSKKLSNFGWFLVWVQGMWSNEANKQEGLGELGFSWSEKFDRADIAVGKYPKNI